MSLGSQVNLPRCFVVTGASSGIGRAVAQSLLADGHKVVGISRRADETLSAHPDYFHEPIDLANLKVLPDLLKALMQRFTDIDGVVCCAGKGQFGSLEEFSFDQIRELVELNFLSQTYVIRAFLPLMKQRKSGHIIVLGSEAALAGGRKGAIYCASKFALRGLAQSLREECAKTGVRVTVINPGMVLSEFFDDLSFAPGDAFDQHLLPEDVAEAILMALNSRQGSVIDEINLSPQKKVIQFRKAPA